MWALRAQIIVVERLEDAMSSRGTRLCAEPKNSAWLNTKISTLETSFPNT
jgi:hypothetical protein